MKPVNQLISKAVGCGEARQGPDENVTGLDANVRQIVNDIFRSLQAAKPGWRASFPDEVTLRAAKQSFVKGLVEANVTTMEQVAAGVRRARLEPSQFFPSVGEFVVWCKPVPADLGLPELDQAYCEACQGSHSPLSHRWSHSGVYHAGRLAGWHELRSEPERTSRPRFKRAYQQILERIQEGESFEQPDIDPTRLEQHRHGKQVRTKECKAAGLAALAALKSSFRIGKHQS